MNFQVVSDYEPSGDQPHAIEKLSKNILDGNRYQTLEGVTGSGKTHTMARVIEKDTSQALSLRKTYYCKLCKYFSAADLVVKK